MHVSSWSRHPLRRNMLKSLSGYMSTMISLFHILTWIFLNQKLILTRIITRDFQYNPEIQGNKFERPNLYNKTWIIINLILKMEYWNPACFWWGRHLSCLKPIHVTVYDVNNYEAVENSNLTVDSISITTCSVKEGKRRLRNFVWKSILCEFTVTYKLTFFFF